MDRPSSALHEKHRVVRHDFNRAQNRLKESLAGTLIMLLETTFGWIKRLQDASVFISFNGIFPLSTKVARAHPFFNL